MTELKLGTVSVITTNHAPLPTDHWAQRLSDRIISVSDNLPPAIRDQAQAFKNDIHRLCKVYIEMAIESRINHLAASLQDEYPVLAKMIREL